MHTLNFHPSTLPYPFAKATELNGILYLSGQVSMSAKAEPIHGSVAQQTKIVMENIKNTLVSLESNLDHIFKVTVWLSDMAYFQEFNEIYQTFFKHNFPARSVIASQLAFNLDVEIEVQAIKIS